MKKNDNELSSFIFCNASERASRSLSPSRGELEFVSKNEFSNSKSIVYIITLQMSKSAI